MHKLLFLLFSCSFYLIIFPMDTPSTEITIENLINAIDHNDTKKVEYFIQKEPNLKGDTLHLSAFGSSPITALHYASAQGRAKCAKILLENDADVNHRMACSNTPLHYVSNAKTALVLLNHKADIHTKNMAQKSPLHSALCTASPREFPAKESQEIALLLLKKGAKINQRGRYKNTILHDAIIDHKIDAIDFLLAHNADVTQNNDQDETPLQLVWQRDNKNIFKVFEKHGIVFFPHVNPGELFYKLGYRPSNWDGFFNGNWEEFLNNQDNIKYINYWARLYISVKKNKNRRNGNLISNKNGCIAQNISQEDLESFLPVLFIQSEYNNITKVAIKHIQCDLPVFLQDILIDYPWVIHYDERCTHAMITEAINKPTSHYLNILLKAGINPRTTLYDPSDNSNFLHYAVMTNKVHAFQALIEYKINFLQANKNGYTPMSLAVSLHRSQCIKELNRLFCQEFISELKSYNYTKAKKILKELYYCVKPVDEENNHLINNLIHIISEFYLVNQSRIESFFKILKNKDADFNAKNNTGETPLWEVISRSSKKEIFSALLLKYGANPNIRLNSCSHSLLDIAICRNAVPLVELFLQYGAIISKENIENIDKKIRSKNIKKRTIFTLSKNAYNKQNCCICFEHYNDPALIRFVPCKNLHPDFICKECCDQLKTCPICRQDSLKKFPD